MLTFFLFCLLAGCAAGFLAGLFGIGGGMVIVPMMVYLLPIVGVPDSLLMSTALGTSFATIVITAFSSAQRHHKLGNVVWSTLKYFAPALMISAFISGQYISKLPPEISGKLFACLVVYLAVKMILSIKPKNVDPNKKNYTVIIYYWRFFNRHDIKCCRYWRRRIYRAIFKFT